MQDRCRQTHTPPGTGRGIRDDPLAALPTRVLATRRGLRGIHGASRETATELDADGTLSRILQAAVDLARARYGSLLLVTDSGELRPLVHVAAEGHTEEAIGHLSAAGALLDAIADTGRTIRRDTTDAGSRHRDGPTAPLHSVLGVPVRAQGEIHGVLLLTNRRAGVFTAEDEKLAESLATTAGISILNARRCEETQRHARLRRALADVDAALVTAPSDGVLDLVADHITRVVPGDLVTIVVPVDDDRLRVEIARGPRAAPFEHGILPAATSVAARAISTGRSVCGPLTDDVTQRTLAGDGGVAGPTVAVPLVAAGHAVGALCVTRAASDAGFTQHEIEAIAEFAARAGLAISLAGARQDHPHPDSSEEQKSVARDLHDNVIQRLFATGMSLQALAAADPPHADELERHVTEIDTAITEIRSGIFSLRTRRARQEDRPASQRVLAVIAGLAAVLPTTPTVTFVGPVDTVVTGRLADDVIAVAREALANIAHHADARNSAITITVSEYEVSVTVQDDGKGLAGARRRSGGTANLAERAALHGGSFTLTDRADRGTAARWTVPRSAGSAGVVGAAGTDDG